MKTKNKIIFFITILFAIFCCFNLNVYGAEVELNGSNITVYKNSYKINGVVTEYSGTLTITNTGISEPNITISEEDVSVVIKGNINLLYASKDCEITIEDGYYINTLRTLGVGHKNIVLNGSINSGAKNVLITNATLDYNSSMNIVSFDASSSNVNISGDNNNLTISDLSVRDTELSFKDIQINLPNFKYDNITLELDTATISNEIENSYITTDEAPGGWVEPEEPVTPERVEVFNTIDSITLTNNSSARITNNSLKTISLSNNSSLVANGTNIKDVEVNNESELELNLLSILNNLTIGNKSECQITSSSPIQIINSIENNGELTLRGTKYKFNDSTANNATLYFGSNAQYDGVFKIKNIDSFKDISSNESIEIENNGTIENLNLKKDSTITNNNNIENIKIENRATVNILNKSNTFKNINLGGTLNLTNVSNDVIIDKINSSISNSGLYITNNTVEVKNFNNVNNINIALTNTRFIAKNLSSANLSTLNSNNSSVIFKDISKRAFSTTHLIKVILNNSETNYTGENIYVSIDNNMNYFPVLQNDKGVLVVPVSKDATTLYIKIDGVEHIVDIQNRTTTHEDINVIKTFFLNKPIIENVLFEQPTRHESSTVDIRFNSVNHITEDVKVYFITENKTPIITSIEKTSEQEYKVLFNYPENTTNVPIEYKMYLLLDNYIEKDFVIGTIIVPPAESSRTEIVSFEIPEAISIDINKSSKNITVKIPFTGSYLLTPTITIPNNCTISPASGETVDFTNQVTYTVTNGYHNIQTKYTVIVEKESAPVIRKVEYTTTKLLVTGNYLPETINYKIFDASNQIVQNGTLTYDDLIGKHTTNYNLPENNTNTDINYTIKFYVEETELRNFASNTITVYYERSSDSSIESINISGSKDVYFVGTDIRITMPYNTTETEFVPNIVLSDNTARCNLNKFKLGNNILIVTAEDGSTTTYHVRVVKEGTPVISGLLYKNEIDYSGGTISIKVTGQNVVTTSNLTVQLVNGSNIISQNYNDTDTMNFSIPANNGSTPVTYQIKVYVDGEEIEFPTNYTLTVNRRRDTSTTISFYIPEQLGTTSVSGNTIEVVVPYGTDLTKLTPSITVPSNATVYPPSDYTNDFTAPVVYTVTAENGTTKNYTVIVKTNSTPVITDIEFTNPDSGEENTIDFTIRGSYFTNADSAKLIAKSGDTVLSSNCTGTVSTLRCSIDFPQNNTRIEKEYSISVNLSGTIYDIGTKLIYPIALSAENYILTFNIPGQVSSEILYNRINVVMPYGTDVSYLRPYISVSDFATINPKSNDIIDFTNPVTYTVTAENGRVKTYKVYVTTTEELYIQELLTRKLNDNQFKVEIVGDNLDFIVEPKLVAKNDLGEDITVVDFDSEYITTITLPENTTNYDQFYNLFIYDGEYAIQTPPTRVKVDGVFSSENRILEFNVENALKTEIDDINNTIKVFVDDSFNLQYVIPDIVLSDGAIVSPNKGERINITNPVLYTVTAEDTTTKEYVVSAVIEPEFEITGITYTPILSSNAGNVEFKLTGSRLYTKNITLTISCAHCGQELHTGTFDNDTLSVSFPANTTYEDEVYNLQLKVENENHPITDGKQITVSRKLYEENIITDFYFYGIKDIEIKENSININVYNNIDITNLKPLISISDFATIHPDNIYRDFTNPVTYTVTAENGSERVYSVNISKISDEQPIPLITDISGFTNISVLGETKTFIIEGENLDFADDIKLLFKNEQYNIEHSAIAIKSGSVYIATVDFESNPRYEELEFEVSYILNKEKYPTSFNLKQDSMTPIKIENIHMDGMKDYSIDEVNNTILANVYYTTEITETRPIFNVLPGLTVLDSTMILDFTTPQEITISNLDGSTKTYIMTVNKLPEPTNLSLTFEKEYPYGGHIKAILTGDNIESSKKINLSYVKDGTYISTVIPMQKHSNGTYVAEFDLSYSINQTTLYEARIIMDGGITLSTEFLLEELTLTPKVFSITAGSLSSAGGRVLVVATGENLHVTEHSSMMLVSKKTGYQYSVETITGSATEMTGEFILPGNTTYENEEYELKFLINHEDVTDVEYPTIIVAAKLRTENEILTFDIEDSISTSIDGTNIEIVMPYYSNIEDLQPIITTSIGSRITPESGLSQDFTNPVEYSVVAQNGLVRRYTVSVRKEPKPNISITNILHDIPETYEETEVLFNVFGENLNLAQVELIAYENGSNNQISAIITQNNGAYIGSMTFPENRTAIPKIYTVKSFINGEETGVNATVVIPGHLIDPLITSFTIPGQISSTINNELSSIKIIVPYTLNISKVTPTIDINEILTIVPGKTEEINLTSPKTYTVSNGQISKTYTIYVERENTYEITDFDFKKPSSNNPGEIDIQIIGEDLEEVINLLTIKLHPEEENKKVIEGEISKKNNKIYATFEIPKNTSSSQKDKYTIIAYISNEKFDYTETLSVPAKESSGGGGGSSSGGGGSSGGSSNKNEYNPPVVSPPILVEKPKEPTISINKNIIYINGYEDNTFKPNNSVTRAEVAAMLSRLITDFDTTKTYTNYFTDVPEGMWYTNAINFMKEKGIIKGDTAGTYRPNDTITRGEFAAILSRMLELPLENNISNIIDINNSIFEKEIYSLIKKGIVSGYEDNTFKPNNSITRAEVVKMINFGIGIETRYNLQNIFFDLTPDHWAYNYILSVATK